MTIVHATIWQDGWIGWSISVTYLGLLLLFVVYGLHRYWQIYLYYRRPAGTVRPPARFAQLPPVTVQLPMYNEGHLSASIIDAACRLDYPPDLLQIQVLDDSTDHSARISRRAVDRWARRGVNIQYLHRSRRRGFKAGALADGLQRATGRFVAIFDADFVPPRRFLRRTIHHFTHAQVGMVQTRWDHMNRADSLLTRCQAIYLDAHFIVEQAARSASGLWINFNGTAGIWRRSTIEDAGGWQADTLTEDLDLSYRAQLRGWRFIFLPRVGCPAQLPPDINAFKSQQHRWTKGSIQTALKLLPAVLKHPVPLPVKVEAFFHLTGPLLCLFVTGMAVLSLPVIYLNTMPGIPKAIATLIGLGLFAGGTASVAALWVVGQKARHQPVWATIGQVPLLLSIGIGVAMNNARGCLEALIGHQSPFVRTPKYASGRTTGARRIQPVAATRIWVIGLELTMGLYTLWCVQLSLLDRRTIAGAGFLVLFASGYLYVGLSSLHSQWCARGAARGPRSPRRWAPATKWIARALSDRLAAAFRPRPPGPEDRDCGAEAGP